MNKTLLIVFALLLSFGTIAQKVSTSNHRVINTGNTRAAYFPVFNNTGDKLLFSSGTYSGLQLYDLSNQSVTTISTAAGAGYEPIFDQTNNRIFYRFSTFEKGRKFDGMESYDLARGTTLPMLSPRRELRQVSSYNNGFLVAAEKQILKVTFGRTGNEDLYFVTTEDLKMVVINNGRKQYLNPLNMDESRYIWVSLSPDNNKILFTAAGKGTYICDLQGKILHSLNYLNAPVWYDNNFVVGMEDKDDGHVITSSSIQIVNIRTNERTLVSRSGETAMHPTAAGQGGKIAYHTTEGKIIVADVVIR
jgi:hypothetical protein